MEWWYAKERERDGRKNIKQKVMMDTIRFIGYPPLQYGIK